MATSSNRGGHRYHSFVDSDDHEDTGGGVRLSDFEDEYKALPTPANSTPSGKNDEAYQFGMTPSTAPLRTPAASARCNTMAPIGTGRPSTSSEKANSGVALSTPTDTSSDGKRFQAKAQEKPAAQPAATKLGAGNTQHQTSTMPNARAQSNAYAQANSGYQTKSGYQTNSGWGSHYPFSQTSTAQADTTTTTCRFGPLDYEQFADNNIDYFFGMPFTGFNLNQTASAYRPQQRAAQAPYQGTTFGANHGRPNPDTTPSHMAATFAPNYGCPHPGATPSNVSKKDTKYQTTTPFGPSQHFNQTEPRNFAPRANANMPHIPPPAFNLGRGPVPVKTYNGSQSAASDSDPFSSSSSSEGTTMGSRFSQALTLAAVPEDDQFGLVRSHMSYGPVSEEIRAVRSEQLNRLTEGPTGVPTQDVALAPENFPFMESSTQAAPVAHGVIKIRNIPFATKRAEIVAFLGRNSKILNDCQEPVHIIMERVTSKTQDCYVEFVTMQDAIRAVERHMQNIQTGRQSRLGDRPVEIQLSSQAALMKDLFPLASGVVWDGAKPVIQPPIYGQPWKTFKGFVTEEEMTMIAKHVEIPQRSPYSKECPQRPYECMISTLKKLPWYMSEHITVRQRYAVYEATVKLLTFLLQALQRETRHHETVINQQLFKRLYTAAMMCPGFSVVQKDNIAVIAHLDESRIRLFNQPRFADLWTHLYTLCPKPGTPLDVLEWYIAIIRENTTQFIHHKPITERCEIQATGCYTQLYFGYMWYEMCIPTGKDLDNMTLRELARRELGVIEQALRRAFPRKN